MAEKKSFLHPGVAVETSTQTLHHCVAQLSPSVQTVNHGRAQTRWMVRQSALDQREGGWPGLRPSLMPHAISLGRNLRGSDFTLGHDRSFPC